MNIVKINTENISIEISIDENEFEVKNIEDKRKFGLDKWL